MNPTRAQAEDAIRTLLAYIGDNPDRPGLVDTPKRVIDAWTNEWGSGYHLPVPKISIFSEHGNPYNEMVLQRGITWCSCCEHHLAPFYGTADIAYIPNSNGAIIGLSKLSRVLTYYSRRLQMQERLTVQVADHLSRVLHPRGLGVVLRATHMCMVSRGVQQNEAVTVTSAVRGLFLHSESARAEFMNLTSPVHIK